MRHSFRNMQKCLGVSRDWKVLANGINSSACFRHLWVRKYSIWDVVMVGIVNI